jgi:4-amino-4-deoxy-L-arabinose transferase-like glycosyltransferase
VTAVAAMTILACCLRLSIMRDSLLGDELFMFNIVHGHSLRQALSIVQETEKTPPLLFVVNWFAAELGDPTYWIRLPSLLFGTALVPLTYALGVRTVGRAAALVAAGMITLSAFGIFYATEARAYSAVAFFAALSTLCLLNALATGRRLWWTAYALAVLAVIYTHYVGLFVVLVQAAWAFWTHRERIRTLVIVHALVLLAFLPWLPSFLLQESHSADEGRRIALYAPASLTLFGQINAQELAGHPFALLSSVPGSVELAMAIGAVVLAGAAAATRARRRRTWPRRSAPGSLIVLLAFAAPAGVALVSLRPGMSFMIARNLSPSFVMAMLLFGSLVTSLPRRAAVPAIAVVVAVMAIGAFDALKSENRRTPYRSAAHFIDAHSPPSDPVILAFFVPIHGPLSTVLSINLSHRRSVYTNGAGAALAWARGAHGEDVFLVEDLPGVLKTVKHLPLRTGPGDHFVRVREHHYTGLDDVLVGEYRSAGS